MKKTYLNSLKPLALSIIIANIFPANVLADDAELRAHIDQLTSELNTLKSDISKLQTQTEAIASQQENSSSSTRAVTNTEPKESGATLWGYGEINYNNPTDHLGSSQMDLRRAVFGIGYRFDDKTRFVSEYEIEHAIASADDAGEVEVEQFYIDHQLAKNVHLKAGLFLIPAGLLNESHEPNTYYGVERNLVETAIIPSTWREGGAGVYGSSDIGLSWDAGFTTTVNLAGWDASSSEGRESPLGSIHQELQLAKADNLGTYGALNYRGVPGWVIGASIFTSKIAQNEAAVALAKNARMTLWDTHTRWTPGNWDLSAVYAKGTISDTKALNVSFVGMPTPVPKDFFGWYTQAAYKVWQNGGYALSPFVRYERINTAANYATMPPGLGIAAATTEVVGTYGASFFLNPNVVIKLDYQHFAEDSTLNRYNLGLGLAF